MPLNCSIFVTQKEQLKCQASRVLLSAKVTISLNNNQNHFESLFSIANFTKDCLVILLSNHKIKSK